MAFMFLGKVNIRKEQTVLNGSSWVGGKFHVGGGGRVGGWGWVVVT